MKADDPRHGSNAGYIAHAFAKVPTCEPCRRAHADYKRDLRSRRYLARSPRLYIPAVGTVRRIRALQALGWTFADIDEASGLARRAPNFTLAHRVVSQAKVHVDTAARYDRAYRKLGMVLAPEGRESRWLRRMAERKGWAPPLAWDNIDDPDEKPSGHVTPRNGRWASHAAARTADLEQFVGADMSLDEACRELGIDRDAMWKWCDRHGRRDLYERLARGQRRRSNQYTTEGAA